MNFQPYFILVCNCIIHIFADTSSTTEMIQDGKNQYQLLQERGKLPKYGTCWTQAVVHLEESCHNLSEVTQSDIALHLTNCFLEMSGHVTYNCKEDKKPNLRGICVNSMSDRAFNVYTEFYTHTQNMCWFLRGQVWYETISETTLKMGHQLEKSSQKQDELLIRQRESLKLQKDLISYGLALEKLMSNFHESTQRQYDILNVVTGRLGNLQTWIMGEMSFFDTIAFYLAIAVFCYFLTGNKRTVNVRLPIFFLICFNILCERLINQWLTKTDELQDVSAVNDLYRTIVWQMRYFFTFLVMVLLSYSMYCYKDYLIENHHLLEQLNARISHLAAMIKPKTVDLDKDVVYTENEVSNSCQMTPVNTKTPEIDVSDLAQVRDKLMSFRGKHLRQMSPSTTNQRRYNLRSRQPTPDVHISSIN